jgi:hypothetical protein
MPLTWVQQGTIGQYEVSKLLMMGTGGKLEVATPLTDDDRRDQEVHARGEFGKALALQIKTTVKLHVPGRVRTPLLKVHFAVAAKRLVTHPLFWYVLAYLDPKAMAFGDPIFFVDSATVHSQAVPKLKNGKWYFEVHASMGPQAHDLWAPYQVHPSDLGNRVLQTLHRRSRSRSVLAIPASRMVGSDLLWVDRRDHRRAA